MPLKERKRLTIQERTAAFVGKEIIPHPKIKEDQTQDAFVAMVS